MVSIFGNLSKEEILELEPEDLAPALLEYLNDLENNRQKLNRYNFGLQCQNSEISSDINERKEIANKYMDAWMWLESEGFLGPTVGDNGEWRRITTRGKRVLRDGNMQHTTNSKLLQKRTIHPIIAQKVWPTFVRGDYDAAIFQAFKEVEVAVRKIGNFPNDLIGVKLMSAAFNPESGPLADKELLPAERQAEAALFVGGVGRYKNPTSHRDINISDPVVAAEIISFASHLLRIIDSRVK